MAKKHSRNIAIVLAVVAGGIMAHRFYLYRLSPIWLLCVFLYPIVWIFSMIEAWRMYQMTEEEFDDKYNTIEIGTGSLMKEQEALLKQRIINERMALERQNILEQEKFKQQLGEQNRQKIPVTGAMADELAAWNDLKEKGLISNLEYEEKRKQILGK